MLRVIYAHQNKHKKSQKVTTERWQYWHDQLMTNDVFLSVLQWTNMQMLQRYFMFYPITQCHSLGHVITSTIPLTFEREGLLVGEIIPDSAELIVAVLWRSRCLEHVAKLVQSINWSCNASQFTSWSCKNYMYLHPSSLIETVSNPQRLEQPTETWR